MMLYSFINLHFIAVLPFIIILTKSEDCINPVYREKYYEELNCIPIRDEANNCVSSYNCNTIFEEKIDRCYYQGKEYLVGTDLLQKDIKSKCIASCRCIEQFGKAGFTCAHIECPSLFGPPLKENCHRKFSHDSCCSIGEYCVDETNNTIPAKCEYDGETYMEGSTFYPKDKPCKQCICTADFNGTVASPWCEDIACDIEIHYKSKIQEYCAPVFNGNSYCCPMYFHCQSDSDSAVEVVEEPEKSVTQQIRADEPSCKYGNLTVGIGRKITPPEECIECSCNSPPYITCLYDGDCKERIRSLNN